MELALWAAWGSRQAGLGDEVLLGPGSQGE